MGATAVHFEGADNDAVNELPVITVSGEAETREETTDILVNEWYYLDADGVTYKEFIQSDGELSAGAEAYIGSLLADLTEAPLLLGICIF